MVSFDTIPHARLLARVEERISDGHLLELLAGWLQQDIVKGLERWTPTGGTPQGAVISPLLANVYLHPLDAKMASQGLQMVRYADDFVILCPNAEAAGQALEELRAWVEANGLTLHPDKTHVGDCRVEGQGFDFLGYRFEAGKRGVRTQSLKALKDRIRQKTRRTRGDSLDANHRRPQPDAQRLVWLLQACRPLGVPQGGWLYPPSTAGAPAQAGKAPGLWPVSCRPSPLAQCILRRTRAFHHDRSPTVGEPIPMRKPPTGEPCAGEPHARFGGRGGRYSFPTPIGGEAKG